MTAVLRRAAWLPVLLLAACGGGPEPTADLAGVYFLDRQDLAAVLLRERVDAMPAKARAALSSAQRRELAEGARQTAGLSDVRLDLLADGGFVVRYRFGREQGRRRGTWRRQGDVVMLETTHGVDGPLAEPWRLEARLEGGALRIAAGQAVPHAFLLRPR